MNEFMPEGWHYKPIKELAKVVSGGTPPRDEADCWGAGVPWVTPSDITHSSGRLLLDTANEVSKLGLASSSATVVPPGTILLTSRATVGEARIAGIELCTNQGFKSLVPYNGVSNWFLYYQILNNRTRYKTYGIGSTFLEVNKNDTERFKILIPDSETEQKKIAAIIDSIDNAIEIIVSIIFKYQQIKAGMMHDLFARGVDVNGHLRPPREQAPELYKESPVGWIPKEWNVSGLRSVGNGIRSHLKTGPFGSSLKGEHWVENGWPVITIGALGEGRFIESELLYVSDLTARRLSEFKLLPGDIVFSRVADVGRSVVVREENCGWIMSSNLMRISISEKFVESDFLQQIFAFDHRIKSQIRTKVNSGGREVANSAILNQLLFPWPSLEEQRRILAVSKSIDLKVGKEQIILDKAKMIKLGLMNDLLSARVRVKVNEPDQREKAA